MTTKKAQKKTVKAGTRRRGRPSKFSIALSERICLRICGGESLRKICASATMPSRQTVIRWLHERPDFCDQYARATQTRARVAIDEIYDIADDEELPPDVKRVMIDVRKWGAVKQLPHVFGDRVKMEHEGNVTLVGLSDFREHSALDSGMGVVDGGDD